MQVVRKKNLIQFRSDAERPFHSALKINKVQHKKKNCVPWVVFSSEASQRPQLRQKFNFKLMKKIKTYSEKKFVTKQKKIKSFKRDQKYS